jgi:hypothetical protein
VPRQSSKVSGVFSRYGPKAVEAFNRHKGDETEYGNFGDLPPGIDGGIAQLVDCRVLEIKEGKQNAGELMFFARGVVVEPEEVEDPRTGLVVRVKNRNTTISEPLFHTPGRARETFEQHMQHILNQLRKLGLSTEDIAATDEELNAQLATLKESAPFFRFNTWMGPKSEQYPNPRVNHRWEGTLGLEDYTPPDEGSPVEDDATGPASPSDQLKGNGSATRPPVRPASTPSNPPRRPTAATPTNTRSTPQREDPNVSTGLSGGKPVAPSARPTTHPATPPAGRSSGKPATHPATPPAEEPALEPSSLRSSGHEAYADEFGDLDSLAEKADAEDKQAQKSLEVMATEAGVPRDAVKKARSWADVAALIAAANQPVDEEEEEVEDEDEGTEVTEGGSPDESDDGEEDEWDGPVVGDMYSYRIGKRLADVEVLEVNAVKQTVTVKNYSEPKGPPIKGVKWEQLVRKPPTE